MSAHRFSRDQRQRAAAMAAAMNTTNANHLIRWQLAIDVFDSFLPPNLQLVDHGDGLQALAPEPSGPSGLELARRVFEWRAFRRPVRLTFPIGHARHGLEPLDAYGPALIATWALLHDGGWQLLGRCRSCADWFANQGDKPKRFCSDRCRLRWWRAHPEAWRKHRETYKRRQARRRVGPRLTANGGR